MVNHWGKIWIERCSLYLWEIRNRKTKEGFKLCSGRKPWQQRAGVISPTWLCRLPPSISCVMANLSHSWATHWETQTGYCRKHAVQTCQTAVTFLIGCEVQAYSDASYSPCIRVSLPVSFIRIWKTLKRPSEVQSQEFIINLMMFVEQDLRMSKQAQRLDWPRACRGLNSVEQS